MAWTVAIARIAGHDFVLTHGGLYWLRSRSQKVHKNSKAYKAMLLQKYGHLHWTMAFHYRSTTEVYQRWICSEIKAQKTVIIPKNPREPTQVTYSFMEDRETFRTLHLLLDAVENKAIGRI
jgi:hypothetical protein